MPLYVLRSAKYPLVKVTKPAVLSPFKLVVTTQKCFLLVIYLVPAEVWSKRAAWFRHKTSTVGIEWFSFECRKTKTKVITLANHIGHRQYIEPIKTRSNYMWLTQSAGKCMRARHNWLWSTSLTKIKTRSIKTICCKANITTCIAFLKQYFGWPYQPSSSLKLIRSLF